MAKSTQTITVNMGPYPRDWVHTDYRGDAITNDHTHNARSPMSMSRYGYEASYEHSHKDGKRPHSHNVDRILDLLVDTVEVA
jgi:hypothetical protein